MGYHLGVDLGTTFTAAAVAQAGRIEVFDLGDHRPQVPSAVFRTRDDHYLVGDAAIRAAATDPSRLAAEFKRRMGDDVSILLGGAPMPPHLLMAVLLRWVVAAVTAAQDNPPESVVVTHPANWGAYRCELLAQAATEADLGQVRFCTEPEAAAVHFASTNRVSPSAHIAVYDLGGGTFDAAVLRRDQDGSFRIVGTPQGIEHLGGIDFDEALLDHVRNSVDLSNVDVADRNIMIDLARLRRECTEAKEFLSIESETALSVSVGQTRTMLRITRADLESTIRPAVLQTVATLARTVKQAGLQVGDLEAIVLVGGSSRIPLVTELLVQQLGRPVRLSPQPKHCVALGAAASADFEARRMPVDAVAAAFPLAPALSSDADHAEGKATADPNDVHDRIGEQDTNDADDADDVDDVEDDVDDADDAEATGAAAVAGRPTVRMSEPAPRRQNLLVPEDASNEQEPPGPHGRSRLGTGRRRAFIGAIAATVLVVGGAIAVATSRSGGGSAPDAGSGRMTVTVTSTRASSTPPATTSLNSVTPSTRPSATRTSNPTVLTAAQARGQLDALRTSDANRVAAMLDGRWVAQLSSKSDGITDELQTTSTGSHTFHWVDILEEQQSLRKDPRFVGHVVGLLSTEFGTASTWQGKPLYVLVADESFGNATSVRSWCSKTFVGLSKAERDNSCAPRMLTPIASTAGDGSGAGETTSSSALPDPAPGGGVAVSGHVRTPEGKALSGYTVEFKHYPDCPGICQQIFEDSDSSGAYSLNLPDGYYIALCVPLRFSVTCTAKADGTPLLVKVPPRGQVIDFTARAD